MSQQRKGQSKRKLTSKVQNGRAAKKAQMELAWTEKLSRRAELQAGDREVADLPRWLLSAEANEKLENS